MLSDAAVANLQKSLRTPVILPSSADYNAARRVWAPWIDRRPALIAKCASAAEVQSAVQFAKAHDLLTAVRCGGHSYAGYSMCDGGMVIDLSPFNSAEVDVGKKIARVTGGALLGNLDRAGAAHGLATTAGVVSHTGIGGLATGGGQGRLARKFGLTLDNIRGVEIVTADGRLLRANATENPDLYWAVRGGGGNFGVVTTFELQLHELDPTVTSFSYTYPLAQAKDILRLYLDMSANASDDMGLSAGLRSSDKGPTTVSISGTYIGSRQAAEAALAPVIKYGSPISTRIEAMDYVKLQSIADGSLFSTRLSYMRSGFFSHVDPKVIDIMVDYMSRPTTPPRASARFAQQGGAISRIDAALSIKHVRELWSAVAPMSTGGVYPNIAYDDGEERIRKSYRGNYNRLAEVKAKYDPTNFFHMNPNIKPRRSV
jgi:FAD/FMN-containing dehydrogenase